MTALSQITSPEFIAWWGDNGGKNHFQLRDAKQIFMKLDRDNSGSLDINEVVLVCKELGMHKLNDKQTHKLLLELDADGDGTVDVEEFDMWWKDNGGAKFRPRAPPAPGDMSRWKRFELQKVEHRRKQAAAAGEETAELMDRYMADLDGDGDGQSGAGESQPKRKPPPVLPAGPRNGARNGNNDAVDTFEVEEQRSSFETQANPLAGAFNRHVRAEKDGVSVSAQPICRCVWCKGMCFDRLLVVVGGSCCGDWCCGEARLGCDEERQQGACALRVAERQLTHCKESCGGGKHPINRHRGLLDRAIPRNTRHV